LVYTLWALPVLSLVALIVYRVFFHPLAKYPGPLLGKFTPILPIWNMVRRTRLTWQYEMVQKYGSPVRVAHNELLFGDAKAWSDIYGQSSNPCLKEKKFYDAFTVTGTVSILNERKRTAHARIRRLVSHSFAVNNLLKQEDIILKKVRQLDQYVFAPVADKGGVVDIFGKMNEHYLDITSYLVFGESFDIVPGRGHITQNDMDQLYVPLETLSIWLSTGSSP
jgi:cytochrome P450